MTRAEFDAFCRDLPAATHVVQWGGASVWKVGGKIFEICSAWGGDAPADQPRFSFKVSEIGFQLLPERPGIAKAPYLARAGWVQVQTADAMADPELREHIAASHKIVAAKLTRAIKASLGL